MARYSSSQRPRRTSSRIGAAPWSSRTTRICAVASTTRASRSTRTRCWCSSRSARGAPGMPEWGAAPIPARLLRRGVKDMVRISDARMSGTSYGTVVLHVAPESAIGGPLALVRDGDEIELNVSWRSLTLRVSDDELARRKAAWKPRPPRFTRGDAKLFLDHVLQASDG